MVGLQVGPELDDFGKHDDYERGFIKGLVDISPSGTPVTVTSTCEHGNKFEMRCPGELVDRHDPEPAKAPGNEQRCVAGESGRIARYRDDPLHGRMRECRRLCSGSGARRIEDGGLKQQLTRLLRGNRPFIFAAPSALPEAVINPAAHPTAQI